MSKLYYLVSQNIFSNHEAREEVNKRMGQVVLTNCSNHLVSKIKIQLMFQNCTKN